MELDLLPDAREMAVRISKSLLADRKEQFAHNLKISAMRPTSSLTDDLIPVLVPSVDGGSFTRYSYHPLLRFTVWHHDADAAFDLCALHFALLLSAPLGSFEQPIPVVSPFTDRDPVTGRDIASHTISVAIPTGD